MTFGTKKSAMGLSFPMLRVLPLAEGIHISYYSLMKVSPMDWRGSADENESKHEAIRTMFNYTT